MPEIDISVVIPTFNSGETIEECLSSVRTNKTRYSYELLVVDAGSTDDTVAIAGRYADRVLAGAPARINRNIGVREAQGDIICFTDSDCIVPEDWIDGLVDGLLRLSGNGSRVVGVGGGNIPRTDGALSVEAAIAKTMRSPLVSFGSRNTAIYRKGRQVLHNPPINSSLFAWVIKEVGWFREEPGYPEDLELDIRINERGYRLHYLPSPLVKHAHKTTPDAFARQMRDFGRKRIRVNRDHPGAARPHHYGPMLLHLLLYSPLLFIPLGLALLSAAYVSLRERSWRFLGPVFRFTLSFYRSYGGGEAEVVFRERTGKQP